MYCGKQILMRNTLLIKVMFDKLAFHNILQSLGYENESTNASHYRQLLTTY